MKRSDLIQKIVGAVNARTYLEIGISGGKNFFRIKAKYKFAVDPLTDKDSPLLDGI